MLSDNDFNIIKSSTEILCLYVLSLYNVNSVVIKFKYYFKYVVNK